MNRINYSNYYAFHDDHEIKTFNPIKLVLFLNCCPKQNSLNFESLHSCVVNVQNFKANDNYLAFLS